MNRTDAILELNALRAQIEPDEEVVVVSRATVIRWASYHGHALPNNAIGQRPLQHPVTLAEVNKARRSHDLPPFRIDPTLQEEPLPGPHVGGVDPRPVSKEERRLVWPPDVLELLHQMRKEGAPQKRIAEATGRTLEQVMSRIEHERHRARKIQMRLEARSASRT